MKKIVSAFLAGVMVMSTVFTGAAQTATDTKALEAAIKTVKSRITIPSAYTEFNFNKRIENAQDGYTLTWETPRGTPNDKAGNLTVNYTNNVILSYYEGKYDSSEEQGYHFAKLSEDQMLAKAQEHFKKLNPTIASSYKLDKKSINTNIYSNTVSINIRRMQNGVNVMGDGGSIVINKDTGALMSLNISYLSGLTFESAEGVISKSTLQSQYAKLVGVTPEYHIKTDYKDGIRTQSAVIVYVPKSTPYIDAKTGKISKFSPNYNGWGYEIDDAMEAESDLADAGSNELSAAELKKVQTEKDLLSATAAFNKLLKDPNIVTMPNAAMSSSYLDYDYYSPEDYTWWLNFKYMPQKDSERRADVRLDAKTGAIINLYIHSNEVLDNFPEKAADTNTSAFLKTHLGKKLDEYKLTYSEVITNETEDVDILDGGEVADDKKEQPKIVYSGKKYTYNRYVNGIKVDGDYINVTTDAHGKVSRFHYNYTDIKFPSPEKIITPEQAIKKLFAQKEFDYNYYINSTLVNKKIVNTTDLLFHMPSYTINANTGKLCDYYGEDISANNASYEYSDLKGHWSEKMVEKLAANGIKLAAIDGKLDPDGRISVADFQMLSNYFRRDNVVTNRSMLYQYLEKKEGTDPITRRDAFIAMVKMFGGDAFTELGTLVKTSPFTDLKTTDKDYGYFVLAHTLGLTEGFGTKIGPDGYLTRAQMLRMVYYYMK